jgi:hypothetical protein
MDIGGAGGVLAPAGQRVAPAGEGPRRLPHERPRATVVGRGGEMREIGSEELARFFRPMKAGNVVVGARLTAFQDARSLAGAVGDLASSEIPLWHLAFVSPVMAAARGLRSRHLLFGAYPGHRD